MIQLQEAIGVDISHIKAKVTEIVRKDEELTLLPPHEAEIVADWYLQHLAADVGTMLLEEGSTEIASLARKFDLPVRFIREVLHDHVGLEPGSTIRGTVTSGGRVVTEAFTRRVRARVRGMLCGATKPVSFSSVTDEHVNRRTVSTMVKDMIASGELFGSVQNDSFAPTVFDVARRRRVREFFKENGYCSYERAKQMSVDKKQLVKFLDTDGVVKLPTCVVAEATIAEAEAAVVAGVDDSAGFVRTTSLLPSIFSEKDVAACVDRMTVAQGSWISRQRSKGLAFACCDGSYVVRCDLLDRIVDAFVERERKVIAEGARPGA